jgi:hypothetical protein
MGLLLVESMLFPDIGNKPVFHWLSNHQIQQGKEPEKKRFLTSFVFIFPG